MAYKSVEERIAESRKNRNAGIVKSASDVESRIKRSRQERTIGFDTFDADLAAASDLVNKVYSGWQTVDDMKSSYDTVFSMRDRLNAHKSYTNDYGNSQDLTKYNESMDKLIAAYDTALADWDAISEQYAMYPDADSYKKAADAARELKKIADSEEGKQGWEKYIADIEAKKNTGEKPTVGQTMLQGMGDTSSDSFIGTAINNIINMKRNDTTYREPAQDWTDDERHIFGAYYLESPSKAYQYAENLNEEKSVSAKNKQKQKISESATSGFGAGLGHTAGALLTAPTALLDYMDDLTSFAANRPITDTGVLTPFEYSQTVTGGIASDLNEKYGTLNESIPIIGGKGWGDVYGLGSSIAQSALSANALGSAGTLVSYFGQGAASGMDEALSRGATDEQAVLFGTIIGAAEGVSEHIGADRLLKIGDISSATIKDAFKEVFKQAGAEGLEEGFSSVVGELADTFIMRDKSIFADSIRGNVESGMSEEDAAKKAFVDGIERIMYDSLSGAVSGGVHASPHIAQTQFENASIGKQIAKNDRTDTLSKLAESEGDDYAEYIALLNSGKASNAKAGSLYRQMEKAAIRDSDVVRLFELSKVFDPKSEEEIQIQKKVASYNVGDTTSDNTTGDSIKVQGIRTDESGNTVLKTNIGERTIDTVTLNRRDAELVAMAEGMEEKQADLFVSMYNGQDATQYKDSFDMAYAYGKNAFGVENAIKRHGVLTEAQALQVYKLGVSERTAAPQKKADAITEKYFSEGGTVKAGTFSDKGVNYKKLNSRQKAAASFAKMFSKATGVNVVLFESKADENGVRTAENGRYDKGTNTVYIDVYAGFKENEGVFEDSMIPTMSHEITHWMKEKAPEAYAKLSEIVMDTLSREHNARPEVLVAYEKQNHKKRGRDVSDEYAQDELIARACEDMLSGNKTANEIIEQMDEETAKTFSEKFKEVVAKIRAWLKELLGVYKSGSEEAKILRRYDEKLSELQKAWDEGLEKAVKANQAMQNSEAEDVAASERTQYSERDTNWTLKEYSEKQLENWKNSKRIMVYKNDTQLMSFVKEAISNGTFNKKMYFGMVSDELAEEMNRRFNVDIHNFNVSLSGNEVRKTLKDHGREEDEAPRGQRAVQKEDFASIPFVMEKPSEIEYGGLYNGKPLYNFRRDGYTVAGVVSDKHLDLFVQTMYVNKKNRSLATATDEQASVNTSETTSGTASKDSIPHNSENIKENVQRSDRDSNGNGLTPEQVEFFKESKVRDENGNLLVMYHGTPNAGFTVFRSGTYFTENKEYAYVYQNQGASSLGYKKTADNPDTYSVYLNIKKPFDTRNKAERDIFYNEYYRKYGMGTDLMESGLPDWMDGMDLQEFLEENGYDYDGLILDEGGVGGYGDEVKSRGLSYVVFNANQVKDITNQNPTADPDIRYSDRQTESIYDAVGELKRIQSENDKLKADIERLRKKNRLERTVTGGRELNESHIAAVAGHVLKMADSRYNKADFAAELKGIYNYLQGEDVTWDEFMSKATDVAQRIVAEAREHKVKDDYAMMILSTIRNARVSFNDTQKAEAEYAYGKNWNRNYFGRVTVANDGIPLESAWSEWAAMYPDVFDADISDADMVTELLDIYDSTRTASEVVETYDKSEAARAIAFEIYNQFWNVSPVRTLADKHDKEVKRLKFEHRQNMKELRERKDAEVFETKWHYSKLIHEVREARDEKIARIKKESHEYTKQYREKVERRNQISQITKKSLKLNTWLKKNSKDEHIVEELKAPVAAVLKALDFSSERFLGMTGGEHKGEPTQKDISLAWTFEHLYDELSTLYNAQGEDNFDIDMPVDFVEFMKGIKGQVNEIARNYGDNDIVLNMLSLEELQDVNKMLSVLTHIVTSANKALADANGKAISTMAQSTMLYADSLGEKNKKVGTISNFLNFDNALPVYFFKMMGDGGQQIFRNMQDGWDKMAFHVKQIIDYSEKAYKAEEVKKWSKEVHEFTFSDGSKVKITTAQIMSLYCLQKREQARLHLLRGGMRVADFKIGTNTITNEDGALMLPHEIDKVVSTLTARQKEVADSLQKFMNTVCSDWGNEVSMRRFGIKSFGEENYFPIQSDASVLTGDDTPKADRGSEVFRLLNMDFTKALNPHANNRIVVDNIFDVFATHTSDMAKYNALALPVLDMFRWYNYKESYRINPEDPEDTRMRAKSLKQSLKKSYGDGSTKYIMQFMKDINGAHSGGMSNIEHWTRKMVANYKVASVGANLRVALLQPTSYVRASAVIDPKYLAAALAHKPQIQKAKDTCGIALWKSLGFYDTNISRGVTSLIKHDEGVFDWIRDKSMKLAEWGDAMTWGYLYNACEAEIKDTQPNLTGAAKDKVVADRLRDVIYATQVVDSTMTRTQNMRDPSWANQVMTSFMSEPSLSYNLLHDLYIQYNADKRRYGKGAAFKKNGKRIARVSASYLITLACASIVGGVFDTLRDDEDEEEFAETLAKTAVENALSDAVSMLPLIRDVVSIYKGFNVGRMDMQGIQSSYYAFRKLIKMVNDKDFDYKTVYSVAKSVGQAASQMSGLPVSNLWREFTTIWNNTIGEMYESLKL